jgi:hypothetical protein
MYPGKFDLLSKKWRAIRKKLIDLVPANNENMAPLRMAYEESTDDNSRDMIAFLLIRHFVFTKKIIKGKKRNAVEDWSMTMANSKNSFVMYVPTIGDVEIKLKEMQELRQKYGLTPQPLIIVTEKDALKAKTFIIRFDTISYQLETPLSAVDTLFKLFNVFNIQYPVESQCFYNFLQKFIYKLHFKGDRVFSKVSQLVALLK